jgi:hypothetical protein
MRKALLVLLVTCLVIASAPASEMEPLPGRDGNYDFDSVSVLGTVWEGKIVYDDTSIVRFDANNVLRIRYFNQTTMQASWWQKGDKIIIEINNKYVECKGVVRSDRIVGSATNKANANWNWEMKRKPTSEGSIFGKTP